MENARWVKRGGIGAGAEAGTWCMYDDVDKEEQAVSGEIGLAQERWIYFPGRTCSRNCQGKLNGTP